MDLNNRVTQLEDEIKVLKNEILAVLLDARENLLNRENPFTPQPAASNVSITACMTAPPSNSAAPQASIGDEKNNPENGKAAEEPNHDDTNIIDTMNNSPHGLDDYENAMAENQRAPTGVKLAEASAASAGAMTRGSRPAENANAVIGQCLIDEKGGLVALSTLTGLIKWVEATSAQLGPERTQTILDISEMMGHMPEELKATLEKFIRPDSPAEIVEEKVATRTYLNALKELAKLLGKDTAADYLVLQIVSNGLNSMNRKRSA